MHAVQASSLLASVSKARGASTQLVPSGGMDCMYAAMFAESHGTSYLNRRAFRPASTISRRLAGRRNIQRVRRDIPIQALMKQPSGNPELFTIASSLDCHHIGFEYLAWGNPTACPATPLVRGLLEEIDPEDGDGY